MKININGKTLDVKLEKEKFVGEVLCGIEKWLSDSGHVLSGISIDNQEINVSEIESVFKKEINTIENLDIYTETISNLVMKSFRALLEDIEKYEILGFEEKANFFNNWKENSYANFLNEEAGDLYNLCENTFARAELSVQDLKSITEERIREINEPDKEFANIESILNEICKKLVDLPLDIQTGKEAQAAKTIQLFAAITEKIMRIYYQLDIQGYLTKTGNENILEQISDFTGILQELFNAYEKNDSVLVGDLAEYEASVRIKDIYTTIMSKIHKQTKFEQKKFEQTKFEDS